MSTAGGIQTVNRKLACALARLDNSTECVTLVTYASADEIEDAERNGVRLVHGRTPGDWLPVCLSDEVLGLEPASVAAIIGHSYFSGGEALLLRERLFPSAKAVHFIHMSPFHTEALKEYRQDHYVSKREQKLSEEYDLSRRADVVACIGPRLRRYTGQLLNAVPSVGILQIDCGFERCSSERLPPTSPRILCMGRADSICVKGLDLFAKAAGKLTKRWQEHPSTRARPLPEFIIRGAKNQPELLEGQLRSLSAQDNGAQAKVFVRPYTTSSEELERDLLGTSVFTMPSREEGFGLVACEALSHGIPIVITSESGLAETILEIESRTGLSASAIVVRHIGTDEDIAEAYADRMLEALVDESTAGQHALRIFEQLLQTSSWDAAARQLRDAVFTQDPLEVVSPPSPSVAQVSGGPSGIAEILERHAPLLKSPGILSVVVRYALVVIVEDTAELDLPERLEDIDVVVRKVDRVRFTSRQFPASGDRLVISPGSTVARVGIWVADQLGNLFLTTVAHAFSESPATARVEVVSKDDTVFPATVASWNSFSDIVLLSVPEKPVTRTPIDIVEPRLELPVVLALQGRSVAGIVTGVAGSVRLAPGTSEPMPDVFEVRIDKGMVEDGDSGCILEDTNKRPIGFIVARIAAGDEGPQRVLAKSLIPALAKMGLRPTAYELSIVPSDGPVRRQVAIDEPQIALLADSAPTLKAILDSLEDVTRETSLTTSYFTGRLSNMGPRVVVHGLDSLGNLSAAVTTTNLLRERRIVGLILVGVAGGVPCTGLSPGDLVVSSEIVHYEPAKITETGIVPRFRIVGLTPAWLSAEARNIAQEQPRSDSTDCPNVYVGPIASGDKVVQSQRQLLELLGVWRNVLAVEMEGAGVATAVSMSKTETPLVVIRGISDIIDDKKNDSFHQVARVNAVRLSLALSRFLATR